MQSAFIFCICGGLMKRAKQILRIVLPLAVGIILFWWIYHKMDFTKIWYILKHDANYWWLILSVAIGIFSHVLRAMRWQMLIRLLQVKPSLYSLTKAVFINYGANLILPRLGEIWRCIYVARNENISFTKIFGTLISERLIDVLVVFLMFIGGIFSMLDVYTDFFEKHLHFQNPFHFKMDTTLFYLFTSVGLVLLTAIYRQLKKTALYLKIRALIHDMWIGIKTLIILPNKVRFTLLTLALWLAYFLQIYVCFFAFHFTEHLGFGVCVAVFVMGTFAYGLPVQGGIGPWHFAVISTLMYYGVEQTEAAAFALIVHTLTTLENAITGIFAFFVTGAEKINTSEPKIQ